VSGAFAHYFVYDLSTGEIVWTGVCPPEFVPLQATAGRGVEAGLADPATQFFDLTAGVLAAKTTMPATVIKSEIWADGVDEALIDNVPPGTRVFDGVEVSICDDGTVEYSTSQSGVYTLDLRHPQHLPLQVLITAT